MKIAGSVLKHLYSYGTSGGFLVFGGSEVTVESCNCTSITSSSQGSLFYCSDSSLTISDSTFQNFEKEGISGMNLKLLEINSSFREGVGNQGAAISCTECYQIKIGNCELN